MYLYFRYLSEIYGHKSSFEGEDMGSMRKLMIKINVALLVFVVIVIIIFVIIKYVFKDTVGVISSVRFTTVPIQVLPD